MGMGSAHMASWAGLSHFSQSGSDAENPWEIETGNGRG